MRTKQIESLTNVVTSINHSWIKLRLKDNTDSISIRVVSYQEMNSELLISKAWILKLAVEHTVTVPPK